MEIKKVIFSGIAGTSLMTAFSFLVSEGKYKNYKEPVLLASLIKERMSKANNNFLLPAGWMVHYTLGIAWAMAHELVLQNRRLKPTLEAGLVFGAMGGLTGIFLWNLLFKDNPRPPKINYPGFYSQLVLAQIIFSITVVELLGKNKDVKTG